MGGAPSAGSSSKSQQLGMAGLDKAMFGGPVLSVPPTCLISLLPGQAQGAGREQAGKEERVSCVWLSSRTDSRGQGVLAEPQEAEGRGPWESNAEQGLGTGFLKPRCLHSYPSSSISHAGKLGPQFLQCSSTRILLAVTINHSIVGIKYV